jgi:CTP synthase
VSASGEREQRSESSDKGGTMRLGAQPCYLEKGSKALDIYGETVIHERHRHRYEVNNEFISRLVEKGLAISGWSTDKTLVEMIEIPSHPWFVACQFHPEFTSKPRTGHPLFIRFVEAALSHKKGHNPNDVI